MIKKTTSYIFLLSNWYSKQVYSWCHDNLSEFIRDRYCYVIKNEDDVALFLLRWGDKVKTQIISKYIWPNSTKNNHYV